MRLEVQDQFGELKRDTLDPYQKQLETAIDNKIGDAKKNARGIVSDALGGVFDFAGEKINDFTDPLFSQIGLENLPPIAKLALAIGGPAALIGLLTGNHTMTGLGALGAGAGAIPLFYGAANSRSNPRMSGVR